jgi:Protein of unknown function (DUF732)
MVTSGRVACQYVAKGDDMSTVVADSVMAAPQMSPDMMWGLVVAAETYLCPAAVR